MSVAEPDRVLPEQAAASFRSMWAAIHEVGRADTGGYRRFAWTREDATLREWFAGECAVRGLDLTEDRMGNQWAWWGDPDASRGPKSRSNALEGPNIGPPQGGRAPAEGGGAAGQGKGESGDGIVTGSHLDSVPDGGAFDGPLGVVSALAAIDALRAEGFEPARPIAVVNFVDEEGARFGVACAGSRVITGALDSDRARALTDADGTTMADALRAAGRDPRSIGPDPETLARVGTFVELHVEQGRALDAPDHPAHGHAIAVGSDIWPHGRWRIDVPGEANHAGTTRLEDRQDAMLGYAAAVITARRAAEEHGTVATIGKVRVEPGGVNAIPSAVTGWLDARGSDESAVRATVAEVAKVAAEFHADMHEESWTPKTAFDGSLTRHLQSLLGDVPILGTGAGHDAGILAAHGIPSAMLFVRNPTGISHSPEEFAEEDDCLAGVAALTAVLRDLAGAR